MRVVTNVEQLGGLPDETVIRGYSGTVVERRGQTQTGEGVWWQVGEDQPWLTTEFSKGGSFFEPLPFFPALLLWSPEDEPVDLVKVLAEHQWADWDDACFCGAPVSTSNGLGEGMAAHQVEALRAAGLVP